MLFTTTVELDESTLSDTPANVGQDMILTALRVWFQYNDEGNFEAITVTGDVGETIYTLSDPDEDAIVSFTPLEFFKKHVELIWLAGVDNYRHDWIEFAFKSNGADADEYDDNTVDCVLQNLLYGQIVY